MLKKRITILNILAATVVLILGTTCQLQAEEFLLFYANDVHGETLPCG